MFDKKKFAQKYPFLQEYITDKKQIKKLLKDEKFYNWYCDNINKLKYIKENLSIIYNENLANSIIQEILTNNQLLEEYYYPLYWHIISLKDYEEPITILGMFSWDELKSYEDFKSNSLYPYVITHRATDILFNYYYKEPIFIENIDLRDIFNFMTNKKFRESIITLLKNNSIKNLLYGIDKTSIKLENSKIAENFISEVFSDELRNNLGEMCFKILIELYARRGNVKRFCDKLKIIIENKDYQILKDLVVLSLLEELNAFDYYIVHPNYDELFSSNKYFMKKIIPLYTFSHNKVDYFLFKELRSLITQEDYQFLKEKYANIFLVLELSFDFNNNEEDIKKAYYRNVNNTFKDKIDNTNLVEELNKDMEYMVKKAYAKYINGSSVISSKSEDKKINDSQNKKHNVRIYELKDNEPFHFLITTMDYFGRSEADANMYGRPAHKLTIDDPSFFEMDLTNGSEIISCSLVDQNYIYTYAGYTPDIIYVFDDIDSDDILGICEDDAALPPKIEDIKSTFRNQPIRPELLVSASRSLQTYNEIAIKRKLKDGTKRKPKAILCYNNVNDASIKHAEHFNVPIIVINTKTYKNLPNLDNIRKR